LPICGCGLYLLTLNAEGEFAGIFTMQSRELLDEITRGPFPSAYAVDSRGGIPHSRISIPRHHANKSRTMPAYGKSTKIRKSWPEDSGSEWLPTCMVIVRGRIPNDDLHESWSEGEGACSGICDGRSHLPLRGKLGWMTPRPGQKKTGKRNASFGALVPKRGPLSFSGSSDRVEIRSCRF
jgi:hypothetical protein